MKPIYTTLCIAGLTLAACAEPEPEPIYVQPNYDKRGNASCDDGYTMVTTDTGAVACSPAMSG